MKRSFFFLLSLTSLLFLINLEVVASVKIIPKEKSEQNNIVQLAILLDTSNSMDGLIEQAKTQLWKIVNEMARSKRDGKEINLYVALYEYGNDNLPSEKGYVRLVSPLTNDLDKISEELFKLKTNGGEEYCGTVISKTVKDLQWTQSADQLKLIFIAGNEPFNQGNVDYKTSCRDAISKGIIINTIYCGNYDEGLQTFWKDGADLADGKYMNIDQNQEVKFIATPYDDDLVQLGQKLNETYIAYGYNGDEFKKRQNEQDINASSVSPSVMVERSITKSGKQYKNESWDLVDAEKIGTIDVSNIPKDQLPKEMQNMSKEERKAYVEKKSKERESIQNKIEELNKQRNSYIAKETIESNETTLDAAMLKIIREQASKKNYSFEK